MNRESVAFVFYNPGSLKFHPSITNSMLLLSKNGYQVDIFKPFNADEGEMSSKYIRIIHGCHYAGNPLKRVLSLLKLLFSMQSTGRKYSMLFGVDAYGLLVSSIAKLQFRVPIVYFSLELLSRDMNACEVKEKKPIYRFGYYVHNTLLKWVEKRLHKKVVLTIIQDKSRWEVLRRLNCIVEKLPAIFVPNSPLMNEERPVRSDYLRRKYDIPMGKIIVFYAGSLGKWTGTDRIVEAVNSWPERFVLVLHGRGMPNFVNSLKDKVANSKGKIILSLEQVVESRYEEIIRSADIGLSWYTDREDPNVYHIGAGSGKLFYYMKHGLPVIVNRFPGMPEIVESYNAGVCIEDETKIEEGLIEIENKYSFYSKNARSCFTNYEFSSSFSEVLNFLRNECGSTLH